MAAMPAVSGTATFPPQSSPQTDQPAWKDASPSGYHDLTLGDVLASWDPTQQSLSADRHGTNAYIYIKGGLYTHNGGSSHDPFSTDNYLGSKDVRLSQSTAVSDHKRPNADVSSSEPDDDDRSKWIHRDKLARIENQELRAAGIILPKPRAQSRPGRDRSQDKMNGHRRATDASEHPVSRSRKNSELSLDRTLDPEGPAWDLRLPEEIAEDPGEYWVTNGTGKGSRIPVAKVSPAPIPADYLDRDAPVARQASAGLDEDTPISLPKPRSRSGSSNALDAPRAQPTKRGTADVSPKKTTNGAKKVTAPKSGVHGRPKTRSGSAPRSGSTTRPTTRSGDLSPISKSAPEGDPPWMISAYKPDPRLPPDQQLLPTVAKRLQQEKWEQEGKFGNIYDKEFRPLNDEGFLRPPELEQNKDTEEKQDEWPLRPGAKSPSTSRPGTSSYSTMPKIQDTPAPNPLSMQPSQTQSVQITRVPTQAEQPPEEKPKKEPGCGCCVVM
ncbi:hypothetical protein GGS23DRAFT_417994 [Durotheca rogersii]|uniref:uncharacterized protein n=1 Tax=Durotheca rogersii TaxID=419775 RepID=UPI00221FC830|nr:uncharacterized protein GGS23DRAFT_417994 [Durotheca rogersii]KAI5865256.1 hypothetical protein GGS23DRAFT_417994 [Durotheca rogersii]